MRFRSREQAGQELALRMLEWASSGDLANVTMLALSRGGVPVGVEIARALGVPLDVLVVGRVRLPGSPEVGIGAIVADDPPVFDRTALRALDLSEDKLGPEVARARVELHARERVYREGRPAPIPGEQIVRNQAVIDGILRSAEQRREGEIEIPEF